MTTFPLHFRDGHIFVELGGELWLIDTGAPVSFGRSPDLVIAGEHFRLAPSFQCLTPDTLSQFVGVPCAGLLGADVLNCFDHIFDCAGGTWTVSTSELSLDGHSIALEEFLGIPIVTAGVGGSDHRMFFDTGAQVSYFQEDSLTQFPPAGSLIDFYPGYGQFETDTYELTVSLGGLTFTERCGALPGLLGATLTLAGTSGILGNAILCGRTLGYFPRRRRMTLCAPFAGT